MDFCGYFVATVVWAGGFPSVVVLEGFLVG